MSEVIVGILDDPAPYPYWDPETYRIGAEWLAPCALVEDWGCGRGYLSTLIPPAQYRGLDIGVDNVPLVNPHAAAQVDLRAYRSAVPGIFMRHVLEHNYEWRTILANAVASFTQRMFLALFTDLAPDDGPDEVLLFTSGPPEYPLHIPPAPTFSFRRGAIEALCVGCTVRYVEKPAAQHGREHCWYLEKP